MLAHSSLPPAPCPAQVKEEMIKRDMRRDELVMPERRWPYLSTQAPVGRINPPDFQRLQQAAPHSTTTELFKARAAKKAADDAHKEQASKAAKAQEERRQQEQKRATAAVASRLKELAGDPRNLKKAQKAKEEEMRREVRQNNKEQRQRAKEWIDGINQKVSARPFLFEQASVDVAVEKAKQDAHDKFDAALRKSGLADLLDPPIAA